MHNDLFDSTDSDSRNTAVTRPRRVCCKHISLLTKIPMFRELDAVI